MRRTLMVLIGGLLLLAGPAVAATQDNDAQLEAAQASLKQARTALQGAGGDYGGHRKAALEHVENALRRVRQALDLSAKHDRKQERKTEQKSKSLQHQEDKLQKKLDKVQNKQEKLAPKTDQ